MGPFDGPGTRKLRVARLRMRPINILVDSFADAGLPNAQMGNAREIISRLDPGIFQVTTFVVGEPDPRIAARRNTRLIKLPERRQSFRIFSEFLFGSHELLFYMKPSPASRCYSTLRNRWRDQRLTVGTVESQCDFTHDAETPREAIRLWERTILGCDYLYSNSRYVQYSLKQEYGRNSDVIPTGADTAYFTPASDRAPHPRTRVLFVGSLSGRKHPELMLAAAAQFPEAEFRIVGDGAMRAQLEFRIQQEGLTNVVMTGVLVSDRLRREYQNADVFFFPSTFEGSPKVVVEAAACGLPVIMRDSYAAETVVHGKTGFQARTQQELFSYLRLLLDRPDLRRQFGDAARKHSRYFDWDCITRQWQDAFLQLTRPKPRKAS